VDNGATWLMVGTILYRSPLVIDQLLGRFREQLTAIIDGKGGEVQNSGWDQSSGLLVRNVAMRIREQGFKRLLFNDIPLLTNSEPDFTTAKDLCENVPIPVFMGGNFRSAEELAQVSEIKGLQGVLLDSLVLLETPEIKKSPITPCE
jgi:phosphoribosylformimino-5-aminoimidazole carboxamide ribonucleotide (ProFAR) isomerase